MGKKLNVGGQAVIEGVMMRGKNKVAIAIRKADGAITVKQQEIKPYAERCKFLGLPLVRGVVALVESMTLGIQALTYSANQVADEEEEISPWEMTLTILTAFGLAILLFVLAPTFLAGFVHDHIKNTVFVNFMEGIIRLVIFLLYVVAISKMKDVQRVFQYHGAEHKVVHAFEAGDPLVVEDARKYSTLHPRCGTNFLLIVMIISIFFFSFLDWGNFFIMVSTRLLLFPVIAGVSYEFIRFAARHEHLPLIHSLILPGLWLQKLTTREPDDAQLEVAIAALEAAL